MSDSTRVQRDEASRIAALARLRFDEAELARITEDLNHILAHVEDLRTLGRRAAPQDLTAPTSSTRAEGADRPDALLLDIASFAPDWQDGFFVVPPLPGVHREDGP